MPILATSRTKDIIRLYEQANGQFENDLVETISALQGALSAATTYLYDLEDELCLRHRIFGSTKPLD